MFNIEFYFFLNGEYIQIYLEQMIDLIFFLYINLFDLMFKYISVFLYFFDKFKVFK